jgi:hypothetical protein
MMKPTIHLNGSGRATLVSQALDAKHAIGLAVLALEAAAPNARDYYPQGPLAYGKAAAEHRERLEKLQSVYREIVELHEHAVDG